MHLFASVGDYQMFISACVYKTNPPLHSSENGISKEIIVPPVDAI
jgi:hypothetical protein